MGKMVIGFLLLTGLIYGALKIYQTLNIDQKMSLTKELTISIMCATVAIVLLAAIVVIF